MKTKFITATVAFTAAFFLSVLLVGVPQRNFAARDFAVRGSETQRNLRSLLRRDIRNGRERDRELYRLQQANRSDDAIYTSAEYAEIIDEYVSASEALDDTDLPPDFRAAWHSHMKIWREHADFLNLSQDSAGNFEMDEDVIFQIVSDQDREITDTWREVILTASKYGVYVSFYN